MLGAGRSKAGEPIDHAVGLDLHVEIGDYVTEGKYMRLCMYVCMYARTYIHTYALYIHIHRKIDR